VSEYGDLVAAALHADAEAAREQIRAAGITCPSCRVNMADLPEGHALAMSHEEPFTARCEAGNLVALAGAEFGTWQDAANVSVYDDFRRREAEALKRAVGTGPANFTGLLDVLNSETRP
jgi:hypothetical protein